MMEETVKKDDHVALKALANRLHPTDLEELLLETCSHGAQNCTAVLLNMGVDKDCVDSQHVTPLMMAVKSGSLETTQLLITWGCQLDVQEASHRNSALHFAAETGNVAICEALLVARANVNARNRKGDTPLIVASVYGHLPVVKLLLGHRASIHCRGFNETSALHEATEHGHYEVCSYLISAKARLEDEDTFGNTPLICAAEKGHVNLVLLYLALGADVNRVSHSGTTALHYAAKHGWTACCKALLHHGAEMDAPDIRRFTPLMMACLEGHQEITQLLLEAKCNVNMVAYNRRTALHYAAERGHSGCCQLLLDAGAGLESYDTDNCTPAMLAVWKGHTEVLQLLIANRVCLHHWTKSGKSILHLAAEGGSAQCCHLLILHGVSMDIRCCTGVTPLISAIRFNHMPLMDYFLNAGCSLAKLPGDEVTALNEAAESNINESFFEKMLDLGADPNATDQYKTLPLWHAVDNSNLAIIKLLLLSNSDYAAETRSILAACGPCSPVTHSIHKENLTVIKWLLAAYAEDAASVLRKANLFYSFLNFEDMHVVDLVAELITQPQSLLVQSRRAVRRRLGFGPCVTQKIRQLKLPILLHNYLLFSDLELPGSEHSTPEH